MTDILLKLAKGNCAQADDPEPWLEPRANAGGPYLCIGCPVIALCREYASDKYWNTVVIGGWKSPRLTGLPKPGGVLPPWADGSDYPLPTRPRLHPPADDPEIAAQAAAAGMTPAQWWRRRSEEGRAAWKIRERERVSSLPAEQREERRVRNQSYNARSAARRAGSRS